MNILKTQNGLRTALKIQMSSAYKLWDLKTLQYKYSLSHTAPLSRHAHQHLLPCSSKWPHGPASWASCKNLLEIQHLNPTPDLPNQSLHSKTTLRWFECTFKFESTPSKDFFMIYKGIWKDKTSRKYATFMLNGTDIKPTEVFRTLIKNI